ncbi:MAG: tRNA (N6-threonylcarbamoyladenosine(37)-N6)-methyltransferase TrmO [Gammaproteobacteria bacterium]|nr:tRNA (N6-threonylcarbamoyladenosine(37)-N6)-methyltransferase TrmO [Gammaproteobacteria bacterium]
MALSAWLLCTGAENLRRRLANRRCDDTAPYNDGSVVAAGWRSVSQVFSVEPVARMRSPFGEKFGVPRQSGLVASVEGQVELLAPYDDPAMLEGLRGFSHIWLTFIFDRCVGAGWRPKVRPPRLGGNAEVGVWASRSPFRPNSIGLSAVRLLEVVEYPRPSLRVAGIDLVDGTPIIDIRPYVPYADALPDATGGFATEPPASQLQVRFSPRAEHDLAAFDDPAQMRCVISDVLALDPRPAYRRGVEPERIYGMLLAHHNIRWRVTPSGIEVVDCEPAADH